MGSTMDDHPALVSCRQNVAEDSCDTFNESFPVDDKIEDTQDDTRLKDFLEIDVPARNIQDLTINTWPIISRSRPRFGKHLTVPTGIRFLRHLKCREYEI